MYHEYNWMTKYTTIPKIYLIYEFYSKYRLIFSLLLSFEVTIFVLIIIILLDFFLKKKSS